MIVVYIKERERPQVASSEEAPATQGIIWKAFTGPTCTQLSTFGFKNGFEGMIVIKFVRAVAFLTNEEIKALVTKVDRAVHGKYPTEIIVQAINMAPMCTYEQTLSNVVNNAARVFESIL